MNVVFSMLYTSLSNRWTWYLRYYMLHSSWDEFDLLNAICITLQGMDLVSLQAVVPQITKGWIWSPKCSMHHSSWDKLIFLVLFAQLYLSRQLQWMNLVSLVQYQHHPITSLQWGAPMLRQKKNHGDHFLVEAS
jgi:hypothetical protein